MSSDAVTTESSAIRPVAFLLGGCCICLVSVCLLALRHFFLHATPWPQGWFNLFDAGIARHVNQLGSRWPWLNPAARIFTEHNLLKDGPVVFLIWIAFFPRTGSAAEKLEGRRKIAAIVSLALFGVVLARILAMLLPFRERPLRTVALHLQTSHIVSPSVLYGWSSFPSDHAVLLFTLAVGLLLVSRPIGVLALLYTLAVNMFLRIYLGLHWPTDLLAGAVIGTALASIAAIAAYRDFVWGVAMKCWQRWPGISAAFLFFLSYEVVDMFEGPLTLAKAILKHHLR